MNNNNNNNNAGKSSEMFFNPSREPWTHYGLIHAVAIFLRTRQPTRLSQGGLYSPWPATHWGTDFEGSVPTTVPIVFSGLQTTLLLLFQIRSQRFGVHHLVKLPRIPPTLLCLADGGLNPWDCTISCLITRASGGYELLLTGLLTHAAKSLPETKPHGKPGFNL